MPHNESPESGFIYVHSACFRFATCRDYRNSLNPLRLQTTPRDTLTNKVNRPNFIAMEKKSPFYIPLISVWTSISNKTNQHELFSVLETQITHESDVPLWYTQTQNTLELFNQQTDEQKGKRTRRWDVLICKKISTLVWYVTYGPQHTVLRLETYMHTNANTNAWRTHYTFFLSIFFISLTHFFPELLESLQTNLVQ